MSIIPDCRIDKYYNEDFLSEEYKKFIKGYDYAVSNILYLINNSLIVYENELNEVLKKGETAAEDEVFSTRNDLYNIIQENRGLIASIISHWAEAERDMAIVSLIDNMNEKDYNKLRKKAISINNKKKTPKKYCESKRYSLLGEKHIKENSYLM